MTTLLVVDDDAMVRSGIAMLLAVHSDLQIVGEAADGAEAVVLAGELGPEVVLMDVNMPGLDGVAATRQLLGEGGSVSAGGAGTDAGTRDGGRGKPSPRVLALTTFDDDDTVMRVIRAGASGFIVKDSAPSMLAEAVRAVAAGNSWLDPSVTSPVLDALRREQPPEREHLTGRLASLTDRELQVLRLMADGLTNGEIGRRFVVSEATVRTHVSRILMKTDCHDRTQAVVLAYRSGLVPVPAPRTENDR